MEVDGHRGCLRSFQALKNHHQHLKVILSIGGGGKGSEPFAAVAADSQCRQRFAHSARELCITYGLDGIDSSSPPPRFPLLANKNSRLGTPLQHATRPGLHPPPRHPSTIPSSTIHRDLRTPRRRVGATTHCAPSRRAVPRLHKPHGL